MALAGVALIVAASLALYVASPRQQLTRRVRSGAPFGWGGLAALVIGLILLLRWAGPATAVFIAMTLAMLVWTIVPPLAAWLCRRGEKA